MQHNTFTLTLLLFLFCHCGILSAAEGQWILPNLPDEVAEAVEDAGLELETRNLYSEKSNSLKDMVFYLSNGYTATLVSKNGLLLCPYEAVYSYLNTNDSLQRQGFYADWSYMELPLGNLQAYRLKSTENITWKIQELCNKEFTPARRKAVADSVCSVLSRSKQLSTGEVVQVSATSAGQYFMYTYTRYSDVRLVCLPPTHLSGQQNCLYPWNGSGQQTSFALIRLWVNRDNEPCPFANTNKAACLDSCALITQTPLEEHDMVFCMGYPNPTKRYLPAAAIDEEIAIHTEAVPQAMSVLDNIDYYEQHYDNKRWEQTINYLRRQQVSKQKQEQEAAFTHWAANHPDIQTALRYSNTLPHLNKLYNARLKYALQYYRISTLLQHIRMLSAGTMYLDLNKENEQAIYSTLADYFENYQPEEERAALSAMHEYCLQSVDSAYYYPVCQWIDQEYHGDKQRMISAVFNKSLLTNKQRLLNYLDKPQEKILAEDPLLQLCRLLRKACRQAYADYSADQQQISELQQRYIEGLRLMQPDLYMRPDANFSLRFSYGKVAGYQPYDGTLFQYNTHLSGWLERHYTHNYSCITDSVFEHLCYLHPNQPVHFLTTCDATVNRMGNAVFNESGELSGMLIGGNAETVCNNYCYHALLQRTIALDIRYITFLLREYIHADRLLEELCYAEAPRIIQPEATVIAADEIGTTTQADNAPTNEESTENSSR